MHGAMWVTGQAGPAPSPQEKLLAGFHRWTVSWSPAPLLSLKDSDGV